MAKEHDHIECANRTQKTIGHLLTSDKVTNSPWVATAAFYKAVHVVEAVFSNDNAIGHTSDHDRREQALKSARKYEHIYQNYSVLKRASTNARYLSECRVFDDYMTPDGVVATLLKHHLHQLEKSAKKCLSPNGASQMTSILSLLE
jgi:hypothetical protein